MEAIAYADFIYACEHPETLPSNQINWKLASSGWIRLISTICAVSIVLIASSAIAYNLTQGSTGTEVRHLQTELQAQGYFPQHQEITGYYGSITAKAVRNYQWAKGLPVDGIAGAATLAKLNTGQADAPMSGNNCNILQRGDRCGSVGQLQRQLQAQGYFPANQTITSYYGLITEQAVKTFQRQHGLNPDGIAGTATLAQLNNSVHIVKATTTTTTEIIEYHTSDSNIADNHLCRRVITRGIPLNVREAPTINANIVNKIPNRTNINIKNRGAQGWVALAHGGYVSASYLKMCP